MKTAIQNDTVLVSEVRELSAGKANEIKKQVSHLFGPDLVHIEFRCEGTEFVDSSGLGALISMHKLAAQREGSFRIVRPSKPVRQVLELTQLHRIFTIVAE